MDIDEEVKREEEFQKLWHSLMAYRMAGSRYLAKKFYLLGREDQEMEDNRKCTGCFGNA